MTRQPIHIDLLKNPQNMRNSNYQSGATKKKWKKQNGNSSRYAEAKRINTLKITPRKVHIDHNICFYYLWTSAGIEKSFDFYFIIIPVMTFVQYATKNYIGWDFFWTARRKKKNPCEYIKRIFFYIMLIFIHYLWTQTVCNLRERERGGGGMGNRVFIIKIDKT